MRLSPLERVESGDETNTVDCGILLAGQGRPGNDLYEYTHVLMAVQSPSSEKKTSNEAGHKNYAWFVSALLLP